MARSCLPPQAQHREATTNQAIVDKIAYTVVNPVAAGAVHRFKEWPGLCEAAGLRGGRQQAVHRPKHFFSERGVVPQQTILRLEMPKELVHSQGDEETIKMLSRAVEKHEARAREELQRLGRKVLGPLHCLKRSPFKPAKSYEVFDSTEPTFAVLGGGKDLYAQAVKQLRTFRRLYREALNEWRAGARDVLFPFGTWLMRIQHGACCHSTA